MWLMNNPKATASGKPIPVVNTSSSSKKQDFIPPASRFEYEEHFGSPHDNNTDQDYDYESELRELGFSDTPVPIRGEMKNSAPIAMSIEAPIAMSIEAPIAMSMKTVDMPLFDDIDESNIHVSDDDLNDPLYLLQLGELGSYEHDDTPATPKVLQLAALTPPPCPTDMYQARKNEESDDVDVEGQIRLLKEEAVALSKRGEKPAALELMRKAKALMAEAGDPTANQRRVDLVNEISTREVSQSGQTYSEICYDDSLIDISSPTTNRMLADEIETPHGSAQEARARALQLKREHRVDEAIQWIRYAKSVDGNLSTSTANPSKPNISSSSSSWILQIKTLEASLVEAKRMALDDAKRYRISNPSLAVMRLKTCKYYEEELHQLEKYRDDTKTPMICPSFQWIVKKIEVPSKINSIIGEDSFHFHILSIDQFKETLSQYIGSSISLHYDLSLPIENPITGTSAHIKIDKNNVNTIRVNHLVKVFITRKKSFIKTLLRKKVRIDIILHQGILFVTQKTIGSVFLPLGGLIEASSCGGNDLVIVNEAGRAIGGSIHADVNIRYPYSGMETHFVEERVLEVGPWLPASSSSLPVSPLGKDVVAYGTIIQRAEGHDAVSSSGLTSELLDKEKVDPLNIAFYISNDAMDRELARINTAVKEVLDEDVKSDLALRRGLLEVQLSMLVTRVQNEELTMQQYLEQLCERVRRDRKLALYLQAEGRKSEALAVMKRILIMETEIKGAEAAEEGAV
jgi:hypothetical protein